MTYAELWAPSSIEEAMCWIDTKRKATPGFWLEGEAIASMVMLEAPAVCHTVVEYGCGVGRVISAIDAGRLVGVDASAEMLAFAEERFPDVEFVQGDGASFPLPDGSADFVFSVLVLQHMDAADAASVVRDVGRVLRRGGRCWLSFSGFGVTWEPDARLSREQKPIFGCLAYTPEIIETLADQAGLHVREIAHEHIDEYHHNYILIAEKA